MSAEITNHECDVLVVGAGGAGLRAAIEASRSGARTAIVTKSLLGKAHTVMAEGGAAAAMGHVNSDDNWMVHMRDTLRGGKFLNNWRMARIHAQEAPDRIHELEEWGAVFDRTKAGQMSQRDFGGHTFTRLVHVGDRTGLELIRALQDKGIHSGIDVLPELTITSLVRDGDRVVGAVGYLRGDGSFHAIRAGAVVIASGGLGKIYKTTSNSWECTGDGLALAARAGAKLLDSEFVQFHPTGMCWPPSVQGILVTEGVRGEGGILKNSEGKRFMFDYIPDLFREDTADTEQEARDWLAGKEGARRPPELLTRDVVAKAIRSEVHAGRGSPHGGAWLDVASMRTTADIERRLPAMVHQLRELGGVDITRDPFEVGPTCHYTMGGLLVDPETTATTVAGLYACGEAAAGLHGANRLGGNSLTDLLVFGRRSGAEAAEAAGSVTGTLDAGLVEAAVRDASAPLNRADGENPYALTHELQALMEENCGIVRDAEGMQAAKAGLVRMRERAQDCSAPGGPVYNPGWHQALALENQILVADAIVTSALNRRESRGAHTRTDFQDTEAKGETFHNVCRWDGQAILLEEVPHQPVPAEVAEEISLGRTGGQH